jgi:hypothetical protein
MNNHIQIEDVTITYSEPGEKREVTLTIEVINESGEPGSLTYTSKTIEEAIILALEHNK